MGKFFGAKRREIYFITPRHCFVHPELLKKRTKEDKEYTQLKKRTKEDKEDHAGTLQTTQSHKKNTHGRYTPPPVRFQRMAGYKNPPTATVLECCGAEKAG